MAKKSTSFKLDDRHLDVLDTKARELGVGKSEFLRNLLDSNQKVQLNSKGVLSEEIKNTRNLNFNEITIAILTSLRREYDTTINKKKPLSSIRGFAAKHDFQSSVVKSTLEQLVRTELLIKQESKKGKLQYCWTYQGVTAFPEYAPISTDDNSLISGSAMGALSRMLGEYDDVVKHLSQILNVDYTVSNSTVRFFLFSYEWYLNWLREVIFPITDVNDNFDLTYYRAQMVDYLLILITNYGHEWEDWKSGKMLDLKMISQKILNYKRKETTLT